jgi:hypothetical protein
MEAVGLCKTREAVRSRADGLRWAGGGGCDA